jgi:hypothetical protein
MSAPIQIRLVDQLAIQPFTLAAVDSPECVVTIRPASSVITAELAEFFRGPQGPAGNGGSGGSDLSFEFRQTSASATWNIVHNFGRYPAVMVVDSAGDLILTDISFPSANNIIIRFSAATTGSAYLS